MRDSHKKILLIGLLLGVLLEGLDGMILSTAMPRIVSDLNGLAVISWVFTAYIIALQNAFELSQLGQISALATFFRQIGATVGTSILGSVLTSSLATQVPERLKANLPGPAYEGLTRQGFAPNVQLLTSSEGLGALRQGIGNDSLYGQVVTGLREAMAGSLHVIFIAALGIALVALAASFFMKEIPLRFTTPVSEHAAPEDLFEEPEREPELALR